MRFCDLLIIVLLPLQLFASDHLLRAQDGLELETFQNPIQVVYEIKKADTVIGIAKKIYPFDAPYSILEIIKAKNPRIKDINLIYPNQELILPSRKQVQKIVDSFHQASDE